MKNVMHINPPVTISVGNGHWRSPKTVTLEVEWFQRGERFFGYRQFALLVDDTVIYRGGGYGIEKFGDYVSRPNHPPEIQLIESLVNIEQGE